MKVSTNAYTYGPGAFRLLISTMLEVNKALYRNSGNSVERQIKIPKNRPNKFLGDAPSFFINIMLLIVTRINVIKAIGKRKNESTDAEYITALIVAYKP